MRIGNIVSLAILGGLAYAGYMLYTGAWKIPDILGATADKVGETIVNVTYPGISPEAIQSNIPRAQAELQNIGIPDPTAEQLQMRAGTMTVSEELIEGGMGKALALAPVTIGTGLAAIVKQGELYDTMTPEQQISAKTQEAVTRQKFMWEHPVETIIGAPASIIHDIVKPEDAPPSMLQTMAKVVATAIIPGMAEDIIVEDLSAGRTTRQHRSYIPSAPVPGVTQPIVADPKVIEAVDRGDITNPSWSWK